MKYFVYCRKSSEGEERQALSIPAQIDEIKRTFADQPDIELVGWFEEAKSAKAPGRPVFDDIMRRIEGGEADGIVAWHPDRLARNSIDGGRIIYALDCGQLKDMRFVSYTFENTPQGKFMLSIIFGYSKYYVDSLSVNVKRGLRKKVEMGWRPNLPPLGYRNERATNTIAIDPERFALLRQAWELLLTGAYSVPQILKTLNEDWGLRTPKRRKTGGRLLALSSLYKIFANPFYAGLIVWHSQLLPGKHKPLVTMAEFEQAQGVLNRPSRPKPQTHLFAYSGGLIHCICGLSVTAEEKIKPSGRRYVYYHCTRRSAGGRCNEPAATLATIERTISDTLREIRIAAPIEQLLTRMLDTRETEIREQQIRQTESLGESLEQTRRELRVLVDLRVRELINDDEFVQRRQALQKQDVQLRQSASRQPEATPLWIELARAAINFSKYAVDWFAEGNAEEKRLILQTIGSNLVLSGRKLNINARFPFLRLENETEILQWCGSVDDVGTRPEREIEFRAQIQRIRELQRRFLPTNDNENPTRGNLPRAA